MIEQARVEYISSEYREALLSAIHQTLTGALNASLPQVPSLVIERASAAVLAEVDAILAQPVALQSETITITDHRG